MLVTSAIPSGEIVTITDARLFNMNDLAAVLGVNRGYIRRMKFGGFKMPGGMASVGMAHRFLEQNPEIPKSSLSKKRQKEKGKEGGSLAS